MNRAACRTACFASWKLEVADGARSSGPSFNIVFADTADEAILSECQTRLLAASHHIASLLCQPEHHGIDLLKNSPQMRFQPSEAVRVFVVEEHQRAVCLHENS